MARKTTPTWTTKLGYTQTGFSMWFRSCVGSLFVPVGSLFKDLKTCGYLTRFTCKSKFVILYIKTEIRKGSKHFSSNFHIWDAVLYYFNNLWWLTSSSSFIFLYTHPPLPAPLPLPTVRHRIWTLNLIVKKTFKALLIDSLINLLLSIIIGREYKRT